MSEGEILIKSSKSIRQQLNRQNPKKISRFLKIWPELKFGFQDKFYFTPILKADTGL